MKDFNYSNIKNQKWDSEILGLIAAIYKEVGRQEAGTLFKTASERIGKTG